MFHNASPLIFEGEYGNIFYKINDNECYLELIEIKEEFRGKGYGTRMMKEFFSSIPECNVIYLEAYSNPEYDSLSLEQLVRFYSNLGFEKDEKQWEEIQKSNSLDDNLNNRIFMTKLLD